MDIIIRKYDSPCGTLLLGSYGDKLCLCDWEAARHCSRIAARLKRALAAGITEGGSAVTDTAARELDEYFGGRRKTFDLPLLFAGTDFQKRVWKTLLSIPYGTTVSYAELARLTGMPKAVRAVANANGANAISIFLPCHRVIGSNSSLTGYAGGLDAKGYLLELENHGL